MQAKKAEIVYPEVSDRKLHVQRKITLETSKDNRTQFSLFCEDLGFAVIATVLTTAAIGLVITIFTLAMR